MKITRYDHNYWFQMKKQIKKEESGSETHSNKAEEVQEQLDDFRERCQVRVVELRASTNLKILPKFIRREEKRDRLLLLCDNYIAEHSVMRTRCNVLVTTAPVAFCNGSVDLLIRHPLLESWGFEWIEKTLIARKAVVIGILDRHFAFLADQLDEFGEIEKLDFMFAHEYELHRDFNYSDDLRVQAYLNSSVLPGKTYPVGPIVLPEDSVVFGYRPDRATLRNIESRKEKTVLEKEDESVQTNTDTQIVVPAEDPEFHIKYTEQELFVSESGFTTKINGCKRIFWGLGFPRQLLTVTPVLSETRSLDFVFLVRK